MAYRLSILCLALLGFAQVALAADYYVSSTHASRSDSNPGTNPNAPWATFAKVKSAWSGLKAGDTIHLARGSAWDLSFSDDFWYIGSGGSAAAGHITIRGDDYGTGDKPIVRRTGGTGSCAFFIIQNSYITLRDFVLDGGNRATLGISIGSENRNVSNVTIQNMTIRNLGGSSSDYVCGIWITSPAYTISDCLFEGNEISDYSAHGLNHYSPNPMINITWRNNRVINTFAGGRYPSANSALQITSGGRGCVFEYNYLEDRTTTEGNILGFGKYASDTGTNTIRFNVITGSDEYGILFTVDHADKKLLYDIYGNVLYNNDRSGVALHPYNSYAAGTVFNLYNNTFYNNYTDGGANTRGELEFHAQCNNTRIHVFNNLFHHRTYESTVALAVGSGFSGTLTHGNNHFWHEGGSNQVVVTHGSSYTVANVNTYEPTAQRGLPLCVNPTNVPTQVSSTAGAFPKGLELDPLSAATTNGLNLGAAFAQSINLQARSAAWSIGAAQYVFISTRPKPPQRLRIVQ